MLMMMKRMPKHLECIIALTNKLFGDDNANVGTTPFVNFDSPRTRACKLLGV
jgi:hypothetical protein